MTKETKQKFHRPKPVKEKVTKDHLFETGEHPSYGVIDVSLVSSTGTPLVGSGVTHGYYIHLSIHEASRFRGVHHDSYHPGEELIQVAMSTAQFAEMIFSRNTTGSVCTLRRTWNPKAKRYEQRPDPPKVTTPSKQYSDEFKQYAEDVGERLAKAKKALQECAGKPSKGRAEEALKALESAVQHVGANMPFLFESYVERMEKVASQAKAEVEAFIQQKLQSVGAQAAIDSGEMSQIVALPGPEEDENENEEEIEG